MIIHADMDAFYVSVELLDRPELVNKPVAVGGSASGRGVISAANYIAREYRVHSALPTVTALQRCPNLILLKPRHQLYADYSQKIFDIFARYTPQIEPLSLDEAFLDVTASEKLYGSAMKIGHAIKNDVLSELKLVVSIGIAKNKFIAKIASDVEKPDGFVYVAPQQSQDFLDPLPVKRVWGVGKVTEKALHNLGITTIKQLRTLTQNAIQQIFGQHGEHLWYLSQGIDDRQVVSDHQAKSISHEVTFAEDVSDREILRAQLFQLTEMVARRLRQHKLSGRTITLKLRYPDFKTITRSHSIETATDNTQIIWQETQHLFNKHYLTNPQPIRLIGIGIGQLCTDESPLDQLELFAPQKKSDPRVDQLSDAINERFGNQTIQRGAATLKNKI